MCSLEEAFSSFVDDSDTRNIETGERRRRKKRKAVLPPEPEVIEPDRPAHRRLPPAELLGGPNTPHTETSESAMLNAYDTESYFPHPSSDVREETVYNLEPDWAKPFNDTSAPDWIKERLPQREAEVPLTPSPWMDQQPTLWQSVPDSLRTQVSSAASNIGSVAGDRLDELQRRLDGMFEKLDEMETSKLQSNHLEILMFILGGLFLLLIIDMLVKQGTQATMLLAAAGGVSLNSMTGGWRLVRS